MVFRKRLCCRRDALFGKSSPIHERQHLVARRILLDAFAHSLHNAGDVAPGSKRKLGLELIQVANDQGVGEVHAARLHLDEHLAGPRLGRRDVAQFEVFRRAVLHAHQGFHLGSYL
jgi:hypothetical protein